jgi:hypothetical protein
MDKNSFLVELSESERAQFGRVDFADQSEPQKVFSAIWELESQVNNGGFAQLFTCADGDVANHAPWALRQIGAKRCADIVARALRVASPRELPADQSEREALVQALPRKSIATLARLDDEFLGYPDDLTELLFAHVAAHPKEFGPVPR